MFVRILCVKIFTQGLFSSLVESSELFSNIIDRVPSNVSLDAKMKVRYVQYHQLFKVKLLHLKALSLCCVKIFMHKIFIVLKILLRRCPLIFGTQLIGAYGTQWVPYSFEVWVCSRIIMSLIWDQFSKDTREKLPKKYSLHQENIFCQRGQVHFSIDRWHCNKSFYQ